MPGDLYDTVHKQGITDFLVDLSTPRHEKINEERIARIEKRVEKIEATLRKNRLLFDKPVAAPQQTENAFDNLQGVL